MDPAWSTFDKRVLYTVYDITERLLPGANAIGVMLGEGWFKLRALRMQIHAEKEGGQSVDVSTDGSWKTMPCPIQSDSVYDAEVYDAPSRRPDGPGRIRRRTLESRQFRANDVADSRGGYHHTDEDDHAASRRLHIRSGPEHQRCGGNARTRTARDACAASPRGIAV